MNDLDMVAAKVKERFTAADVTVDEAHDGYRIVIVEPGHRPIVSTFPPHMLDSFMVDATLERLWILRRALR